MRVAIVSDIHGSLHALRAVITDLRKQAPDVVLHGGDLVVNGPYPDEVVSLVREMNWNGVIGNTDEMLWRLDEFADQVERMPRIESLLRVLYNHTAPAAAERLSQDNLAWLRTLPERLTEDRVTLVHATPRDLWRAPLPEATDEEFEQTYGGLQGDVVVYGHVHRPFVRDLGTRRIANSGSAGLAWDGDHRASYLIVDDGTPSIHRVPYDVDADITALFDNRIPYARWLADMRTTGTFISPDTFDA